MKIGVLGFTGSGKKTVFQLLTGVDATQKRGVVPGMAKVQDPRVDRLNEMYKPKSLKHAEIEFLVMPAVEIGGTSGAKWIANLRDADAIVAVVRDFDDPGVFHPHDTIDPNRDAAALETEFILADLALAETRLARIEKDRKHNKEPRVIREKGYIEQLQAHLEEEKPLRTMVWDEQMDADLRSLEFLSRRPLVIVKNTDREDATCGQGETGSGGVEGVSVVTVNAKMELEVAAIEDPAERAEFLSELGIPEPAIAVLTRIVYDAAGLISFFTVGEDEVRAWTVRKGSLAPYAAGKIHTDLERGFSWNKGQSLEEEMRAVVGRRAPF